MSMSKEEKLRDVYARFIACLPQQQYGSWDRLLFELELAHWFFVDIYMKNKKASSAMPFEQFMLDFFQANEPLQQLIPFVRNLSNRFSNYKAKVPVCGVIMMNKKMTNVVMIRHPRGSSFSVPRGKINENEAPLQCAIREAREETGYDCSAKIVPNFRLKVKGKGGKTVHYFIAKGVPEKTKFQANCQFEVAEVGWRPLTEMLSMMSQEEAEFFEEWVSKNGGRGASKARGGKSSATSSGSKDGGGGIDKNHTNADTFGQDSGTRYTAQDMFKRHEQEFGGTTTYSFEQYTTSLNKDTSAKTNSKVSPSSILPQPVPVPQPMTAAATTEQTPEPATPVTGPSKQALSIGELFGAGSGSLFKKQ